MAFELTDKEIQINVWQSAAAAGLSMVLCLFILGASLWVWMTKQARSTLDRVSFRLLLWSLVFEVIYDIDYIVVEIYSAFPVANAACASGVYMMMATLGTVNYLCTCIAINLALTICFGINPIQKKLERWYVGVSIALGFVIPFVPAVLGHFGNDPVLNVCWIKARDDDTRLRYFVLDLYLWQILSCVVAVVAVTMTLVTLFRQRRDTSRALFDNPLRRTSSEQKAHVTNRGAPPPISTTLGHLEDKFLRIALRIAAYPVALILVNGIITVGDLYISVQGGVHTKAVYVLYCMYYFLYGGRGIVFAMLGFFVDPSLRKGVRAAWNARHPQASPAKAELMNAKHSLAEMLDSAPQLTYQLGAAELVPAYELPRRDSTTSIDMSHALSRLPLDAPRDFQPKHKTLSGRNDPASFTRSFSGVRSECLPEGLTDDVDVDLRLHARGHSPRADSGISFGPEVLEEPALEPLEPDLPNEAEQARLEQRAAVERQHMQREAEMRLFEETQARL